ncbi:MAG TPA: cupin domain-containing protein [Stellaceae bacterium]|jgi:mannose-6-phosphate isomerase-like protein (cupin superfamily)|nr:cupin domain-containing protein [Stellaceae bacterium]
MPQSRFDVIAAETALQVAAPDGSTVHILCATGRGSSILFELPPGAVSTAVAHRTIEEIWFVVSGNGRLWRGDEDTEIVADLAAGMSLAIPVGVAFQFRCDGPEALRIFAVTIPPWPGPDEAYATAGKWAPTV